MTYVMIVPAKWSVPNWDILQPEEWLWAAAQNIWRLFSEFMQHMFPYKLNSEKMCIRNRVMLTTASPVTNYNDLPLFAVCLVEQLYIGRSNHMCCLKVWKDKPRSVQLYAGFFCCSSLCFSYFL